MNDLSPTTKALLRTAREDGPSAASRDRIWSGVATTAAGGSALGVAMGSKALAGSATTKLLVMGALLGSAVTVGVAAMALHVGATPKLRPEPTAIARVDVDRAVPVLPAPQAVMPATGNEGARAATEPAGPSEAKHVKAHARATEDLLAREAELVAEARGAVVRGEPAAALAAIRAAEALPGHALEPEELSLEVRALRALGQLDAANAAEAKLRAKYPDNALAR